MIVTRNLRDFPADRLAPHALVAEHPDAFVAGLLESDLEPALAAVRGHGAALRNPSRSVMEHLAVLERLGLPCTVSLLRAHEDAI